jgi:hypothetical protein
MFDAVCDELEPRYVGRKANKPALAYLVCRRKMIMSYLPKVEMSY